MAGSKNNRYMPKDEEANNFFGLICEKKTFKNFNNLKPNFQVVH